MQLEPKASLSWSDGIVLREAAVGVILRFYLVTGLWAHGVVSETIQTLLLLLLNLSGLPVITIAKISPELVTIELFSDPFYSILNGWLPLHDSLVSLGRPAAGRL